MKKSNYYRNMPSNFSGALRINLYRANCVALAQAEYLQQDSLLNQLELQLQIMDSLYELSHLIKLEALEEAEDIAAVPGLA